MRWLPPLNALRSFEAAGRLGNVRDAARELNVTAAAINHQIRVLEQHLGADLFARTKSGLVLTPKGQQLSFYVSAAFEQLMRGYRMIGSHTGANSLIVEGPPSFVSTFIMPRLHRFHARYPDIRLELNALAKPLGELNFAETTADISIRAGTAHTVWQGMHAELLAHQEMFPVCSPALLKGEHALRTPADLAHQTLLIGTAAAEGWEDWITAAEAKGHDMSAVDPREGMRFNPIHMAMLAAVQGLGVDMGRRPFVDAYLASGLLVEPFDIRITTRMAYWIVCPKNSAEVESVRAFRHWLRRELDDCLAGKLEAVDITPRAIPSLIAV